MRTYRSKLAMTLVEILIASTLGIIVTTGALRFLIQTLKTYQYETGKLLVTRDIRKFTGQMVDDATYANYFLIFDQISNLARGSTTVTASGSNNPTGTNYRGYSADLSLTDPDETALPPGALGKNYVQSGLTGDVVVFVYNKDGDSAKIYQLIIYYRPIATTTGSNGTNSTSVTTRTVALKRVVVSIYDDGSADTVTPVTNPQKLNILRLLPDPANVPTTAAGSNNPNNMTIFPYVDGQANDNAVSAWRINKMFYNLNSTSVLVRGRIYENYTAQRLVKSTYNFTVTPRG